MSFEQAEVSSVCKLSDLRKWKVQIIIAGVCFAFSFFFSLFNRLKCGSQDSLVVKSEL